MKYRDKNRKEIRKQSSAYGKKNRGKINLYIINKKKKDNNFSVRLRLRNRITSAIKRYLKTGKIMSSKEYGINLQLIIEHLKPFPKDLSKYHIDHIKPLCSFNLNSPEEIKKAFSSSNYQWLTIQENLRKGNRLVMPQI